MASSSKASVDKFENGVRVGARTLPNDAGGFAYAIMFYQGIGQLFPWNAFITASNYFGQRFCTTPFAFDFENYLSISFTASQTIGLAVTILYGARLSYHDKIVYPLVIYAMFFGLTTALVLLADINGTALFWITLLCCIGCGLSGAFLNAGFFSLSGVFPQSYTGAMMSGQGLAGLSVALTSLITQAVGPAPDGYCSVPDDDAPVACVNYSTNWSAFSYFLIATIVLASCIVLFFILMKLPFTIFLLRGQANLKPHHPSDAAIEEPLLNDEQNRDFQSSADDENTTDAHTYSDSSNSYQSNLGLSGILKRNQCISNSNTEDEHRSLSLTDNPMRHGEARIKPFNESNLMNGDIDRGSDHNNNAGIPGSTLANIIGVFNIIKVPALTVFGVFAITLSMFPSLIVSLVSTEHCEENASRMRNDLFVPIFFVLFSLGDFSGRIIAGKNNTILTPKNIGWISLLRLCFFPLFLMCNISESKMPIIFTNDIWPLLFMAIFSLSNGYVSSCCMMMGPGMVDSTDAPMAGNIMIFSLTAGLMAGSGLSFVVTFLSQGHL